MMMTAAGDNFCSKSIKGGAGVASLQAIATAKRIRPIVFATDVRIGAKEN